MSLTEVRDYNVIITDTSCIILFSKIKAIDILPNLFRTVTITPEIQQEIGSDLPRWIEVRAVQDLVLIEVLKNSVDIGEASAIALAMETQKSLLIVDDLKGRKLASKMQLNFMGTLGVLIKAKEHNVIPNIRPYISKIQETNFRIAKDLINYALQVAGED